MHNTLKPSLPLQLIAGNSAVEHIAILAKNYQQYFAEPMIADCREKDFLQAVWQGDFVVLSHGIEEDPIFNFANICAQQLFEMDYQTITQLPSRKSAGPSTQQERNRLMSQVTTKGCIDDYSGIRVSATGKQFFIESAKVWNLTDEAGEYYGQAAMFSTWQEINQ
jgi:hypothetical protein